MFLFFVKLGNFGVWLRLTPVSSCVSCVGLLVQDLTDTILSSYAYKSHYLLTESNRAELKLPMIPSPSSATKKNVGKGNWTVFLFLLCPTGLCLCCACSRFDLVSFFANIFHFKAFRCKVKELSNEFNAEWHNMTLAFKRTAGLMQEYLCRLMRKFLTFNLLPHTFAVTF